MIMLCPQTAIALEGENTYFEIAQYDKAVSFMSAMGILSREDDSLSTGDWTISRGEFIRIAVKAMGQDSVAESLTLKSPFIDVDDDHIYANQIKFAGDANYLGKDIGKLLKPDEPLTMEFAARIGVSMTGRDILLNAKRTYLTLASSIKLFDDVEIYDGDKISRGGALMFLKNALNTHPLSASSATLDGTVQGVKTEKNKTVLSELLGLERREGIVTSDGFTTVYGEKPKAGYITVDGELYLNLYEGVNGLAGKKAEFYVSEDDGIYSIKHIEEIDNSVIILDSKQISDFDTGTASYNAFVDGEKESLRLSKNAYIAYNFEPDYDAGRMVPASGVVTLIDNDDDGEYDSVIISEFTNVIVDTYSEHSETIYDYEDSTKNINLSQIRSFVILNEGNTYIEPEKLERNNILSVYKSADGKNLKMQVSANKKTGTLKQMSTDDGNLMIGNQSFKFSKDTRFDISGLKPGLQYTFYLDALGEIAYVTTDGGTVAYLTGAEKGKALSDSVKIQLLPEDTQKLEIYELAKNVSIETPIEKKSLKRTEAYDFLREGENFKRQMALLRFNDAGEIKAITTAMDISTYEEALTAPEYPLYHLPYLVTEWPQVLGGAGEDMTWRYTVGGFSRWIILANGAQMFHVPNGNDPIDDPTAVAAETLDYRDADISIAKDMGYYTKDIKDIAVRYIVNYGSAAQDDPSKESIWPEVVTDIVECYSEKLGQGTIRLSLAGTGAETTLMTSDKNVILKENLWEAGELRADKVQLEVGDVIRYTTDEAGFIKKISIVYDAKAGINDEYNDNGDTAPRFGVLMSASKQDTWSTSGFTGNVGNLVRKRENVIEVSIDKTDTIIGKTERLQRFVWGASNTAIMVDYSGKKPKVTRGYPANELEIGDRILSIGRAGQYYYSFAYRR